ncbi:hypothetical protein [Paenibacillus tengchongensis]|uniref:hypothetical protein n=1 Tax=Paenibacillus tengchongensis TaxID=2608684 RepID=UPI00124C48BE|nr:hypothetical protein [Paenibacillus tengchongensis]
MLDLSALCYPLTANPAAASEFLPCRALRPYIHCFWETAAAQGGGNVRDPDGNGITLLEGGYLAQE